MSYQKSQSTFITNNETKILKERISSIIGFSKELKFLVGFFFFSGIRELYEAIKDNPNIKISVLVGLDTIYHPANTRHEEVYNEEERDTVYQPHG